MKRKGESYRDKNARINREIKEQAQKRDKERELENKKLLEERKKKCYLCATGIPLDSGGLIACHECDGKINGLDWGFFHYHVEIEGNSSRCLHCGRGFPTLSEKDRAPLHAYLESIGVKEERAKYHLELCIVEKTAELEEKVAKLKKIYGEKIIFSWLSEFYQDPSITNIIKKELQPFIAKKSWNPYKKNKFCHWDDQIQIIIKNKLNTYDFEFPFHEKCKMCLEKQPHASREECPSCFSMHHTAKGDCGATGNGYIDFTCCHCGEKWTVEV